MKTVDVYSSSRLLEEALLRRGYEVERHHTRAAITGLVSPHGKKWYSPSGFVVYPFISDDQRRIALHKYRTYKLASDAGYSVPFTRLVTDLDLISDDELEAMLHRYKKLIVKPEDKALSKGLTLNIQTLDELKKALKYAHEFSSSCVIQQQVYGEEIRFTILDGKVVAALLRQTARVVGDGVSTIAQLIKRENQQRESLHFTYLSYPQLNDSLVDAELLSSDRIPDISEVVELNNSTMIKGGCSVYDVLGDVHSSYLPDIERLVKHLGAGFIVADIFCVDYTQPASKDNHWLIEFNSAPVLKMYYSCRDDRQFDVITHIVDSIDAHMGIIHD